jgi:superfamily I DNA and/or RNA helicase
VEAWGAGIGDPVVRTLLAKSALEILVEVLPDSHIAPLTWQRRMPKAIADFVSASFYAGKLQTGISREHRDPLFGAPFAFVDTSKLPVPERREQSGRAREAWGQSGYVNGAEADLLAELAMFYHRRGADWAVIVPYRAQLAMIKAALAPRIGDVRLTDLNVGTVDSFQGGERDVILWGFTRSNHDGRVGFLRELRRVNVAFSRAKEQLVLVGDMETLTSARDGAFRELAESLRGYLAERGEVRRYSDIRARLADRNS